MGSTVVGNELKGLRTNIKPIIQQYVDDNWIQCQRPTFAERFAASIGRLIDDVFAWSDYDEKNQINENNKRRRESTTDSDYATMSDFDNATLTDCGDVVNPKRIKLEQISTGTETELDNESKVICNEKVFEQLITKYNLDRHIIVRLYDIRKTTDFDDATPPNFDDAANPKRIKLEQISTDSDTECNLVDNQSKVKCTEKGCEKLITKYNLRRHIIMIHSKDYNIHCRKCWKGFLIEKDASEHEQHCKNKSYKCIECDIICLEKSKWEDHMQSHARKKTLK